eukprot:820018-Pyramimonas_sp.AAC.1
MSGNRPLCRGRHEAKKTTPFAQSGYDGYCKGCYRTLFPDAYNEKQAARKSTCKFCGLSRELVNKTMCKPCARQRSCHVDGCTWFNQEGNPLRCTACDNRTTKAHAIAKLCAMRCPTHTTAEERALGLCHSCASTTISCALCCAPVPSASVTNATCSTPACRSSFSLCLTCATSSVKDT